MNKWLIDNLVCPRDHGELALSNKALVCALGHEFQYVDDIPIMLLDDVQPTQSVYWEKARNSAAERDSFHELSSCDAIDDFVQKVISATSGNMFKGLIDRLDSYPISKFPLSQEAGSYLLDIGCNWGRWCLSAARNGYKCVGIDPNLEAILAARRIARKLKIDNIYIVADARYLPFRKSCFDSVFSYSVIQHFSKQDAKTVLLEVNRVLKPSGVSMIQMSNSLGVRNTISQGKRLFREARDFEVRYWLPWELRKVFSKLIGTSSLLVDGFFSLNAQLSELDMLPLQYRILVRCSEILKLASKRIRPFKYLADSLYVKSVKRS
jgi:2-polyprenyl-3-methyl-5-hydroxy-6-metoxy-1,4-benzoquinol methylase